MDKKVLILRSCKNDFEKIVKEESKYRYLEVKKYWETRVLEKDGTPKIFDEIHLKNGYSSDSPELIMIFGGNEGIEDRDGIDYFKIKLGKILEIKNYTNATK